MRMEVRHGADAVLWLWSAHNKVNKRLVGSTTEDRAHPKIQFPSPSTCPQCRYKINLSQETWNKQAILEFLVKFYSKEALHVPPSNSSLFSVVDKFQLTEMFSFFDLGICLFLYPLMFILVCMFYIMFMCKRRRRRVRKLGKEPIPI